VLRLTGIPVHRVRVFPQPPPGSVILDWQCEVLGIYLLLFHLTQWFATGVVLSSFIVLRQNADLLQARRSPAPLVN